MENKAFLIDFEAVVNVARTLQIKSETEAQARLKMAEIIKQASCNFCDKRHCVSKTQRFRHSSLCKNSALEQEDCIIELDLKNQNADNVTIKEVGNSREIKITGILPLN